ncbi:hypothetical protein UlMin_014567, partial [Ulmus minor]
LSDCMDLGNGAGSPLLHVVNPTFDYVPPKLVRGHNLSYMYRLIAYYYSVDDLVVQRMLLREVEFCSHLFFHILGK